MKRQRNEPLREAPSLKRRLARALVAAESAPPHSSPPQLIGLGSVGCIFAPPVPCEGGARIGGEGDVAKLQPLGAALERERAVLDLLERVDPAHAYHFPYRGSCPARQDDADACAAAIREREAEIDEEDGMEAGGTAASGAGGVRSALVVTARGYPLPAALPAPLLFAGLENLRRGLTQMAQLGIRYTDLHRDNVMVGTDGRMRLIDFGDCEIGADPEAARRWHMRILREFVREAFAYEPAAVAWADSLS
jgi:hypothetical protein